MNSKLSKVLIFLIIVSVIIGVLPTSASENTSVNESKILNQIIEYELSKFSSESIQAYIDGALCEKVGSMSEWYVLALCQSGKYDFSKYVQSLNTYLENNEINSASSRLKMILSLVASGSESEYIVKNLDTSIGKQGIMSLIFGLHVLNNGITSEIHSTNSLSEEILSLQLDDGSWATNNKNGDVDTTAMAIQALSPYYEDEKVKTAIDKALDYLSSKQKENGGFVMYGVNNPESASQVLIALSSLGIDCKSDERFIKNGNTIIDAISVFRLDDGSFAHTEGGNSNGNATAQVLCAMVAYTRMSDGKTPFYILDKQETVEENTVEITASEPNESLESNDSNNTKIGYKVWIILRILVVAIITSVIFLIIKKKNGFIIVAIIALIAIIFVACIDFEATENYYGNAEISKENVIGTVTLSIRCDSIVGIDDLSYIPENGIILDTTEFEIADGDTVYDILREATAKNKIHLEINGNADTAYVEGISNIYEFDYGNLSGWTYMVNGAKLSLGCGEYKLAPNDKIEWVYSIDMSDDWE